MNQVPDVVVEEEFQLAFRLPGLLADQDERPVLLMQAGRAGHGVGKPATMRIAEGVDVLSFLWWQLRESR